MERLDFPMVGECCYYQRLENGLDAFVVSKPGYAKKMAMLAVNYGGMNPEFTLSGSIFAPRRELPTIWSIRCSICATAAPSPGSVPTALR